MKPSSSKGRNPEKSVSKSPPSVKKESPESNPSIVPYAGHSPISLVNQYSALDSTLSLIKPNYQSALVNQYDPYKTDSSSNPTVNYKKIIPLL